MAFPTAVAGPSRIPMQITSAGSRRAIIQLARRWASDEADEPIKGSPAALGTGAMHWGSDKVAGRGKTFRTMLWPKWVQQVGKEFESITEGKRARWLGGDVPYPANPSFRPPPPLSNEYQTFLYSEIQKGAKTIGEISVEFNVSKGRLEAIKKLKEIEQEYTRQSIPLQVAFQKGMEPLLGAENPRQSRWGADARPDRESMAAELDEEKRWDQGIGEGGSFGDRTRSRTGIERTVFEWREEDDVLASRAAGVSEDLFPTPASELRARQLAQRSAKEARPAAPEKIIPTRVPTTTWRFVDVSAVGVRQSKQVKVQMEKRVKMTEKKSRMRNRRKGIYE